MDVSSTLATSTQRKFHTPADATLRKREGVFVKTRFLIFLGLLIVLLLYATISSAAPPTFKHVIVVIQENRTPDNLFGGNSTFEYGVDIQQGSQGPWCLGACFSPDHSHLSWTKMWNNGGSTWNNGGTACQIPIHNNCFIDHENHPRITSCNGLTVGQGTLILPTCMPETFC